MLRCSLALTLLLGATAPAVGSDSPSLLVLGIAQDAGYPQAGCEKDHCRPAWEDPARRRGATCLGLIDPAANSTYLFEATPNLPEQLHALHEAAPDAPLTGVFLTHAHIGHYAGLMHLGREVMGTDGIPVYAMPRLRTFLEDNGPWSQLVDLGNIELRPLAPGEPVDLGAVRVTPFPVPHRDEFSETVGYRIEGPNRTAVFIPDIDKWDRWETPLADVVRGADVVLIDATFYADGELGRDMSRIPHPFVTESMDLLRDLPADERAKVHFIHMNHTNPLLLPDSPERKAVRDAGFGIAEQGMRLGL